MSSEVMRSEWEDLGWLDDGKNQKASSESESEWTSENNPSTGGTNNENQETTTTTTTTTGSPNPAVEEHNGWLSGSAHTVNSMQSSLQSKEEDNGWMMQSVHSNNRQKRKTSMGSQASMDSFGHDKASGGASGAFSKMQHSKRGSASTGAERTVSTHVSSSDSSSKCWEEGGPAVLSRPPSQQEATTAAPTPSSSSSSRSNRPDTATTSTSSRDLDSLETPEPKTDDEEDDEFLAGSVAAAFKDFLEQQHQRKEGTDKDATATQDQVAGKFLFPKGDDPQEEEEGEGEDDNDEGEEDGVGDFAFKEIVFDTQDTSDESTLGQGSFYHHDPYGRGHRPYRPPPGWGAFPPPGVMPTYQMPFPPPHPGYSFQHPPAPLHPTPTPLPQGQPSQQHGTLTPPRSPRASATAGNAGTTAGGGTGGGGGGGVVIHGLTHRSQSARGFPSEAMSTVRKPRTRTPSPTREHTPPRARSDRSVGSGRHYSQMQNHNPQQNQQQHQQQHEGLSLTTDERACVNALRARWEAKESRVKFPPEWYLRFAQCSPGVPFTFLTAWKVMGKFQPRHLELNAVKLEKMLLTKLMFPIQGLKDLKGHDMFYMKASRFCPRKGSITMFVDLLAYVMECMLDKDEACRNGIGLICDLTDFKMKHFSVPYFTKFMATLQGRTVPTRVETLLFVNPPPWFGYIWTMMKTMTTDTFRKKIHAVPEEELSHYLQHGSEQYLPSDMECGLADAEIIVTNFIANRKRIEFKRRGREYP